MKTMLIIVLHEFALYLYKNKRYLTRKSLPGVHLITFDIYDLPCIHNIYILITHDVTYFINNLTVNFKIFLHDTFKFHSPAYFLKKIVWKCFVSLLNKFLYIELNYE